MKKEYYMEISMEDFLHELSFMDYEELKNVEDHLNKCASNKRYKAEKIVERLDVVNSEIIKLIFWEMMELM